MQKDEYKKLKRLSLIGVLFTVLFTVMLTGYIREQKKQELETKLSEDTKQLNEFKTRFQQYRMSKNSKEKERYTVLVANYETGLQNKDLVFIEACQKNLKQLEKK